MLRLLAVLVLITVPTVVIAQRDTAASDLIEHLLDNFDNFQNDLAELKDAEKEEDSLWKTLTWSDAKTYEENLNKLLDDALDLIATDLHERWIEEIDRIERDLIKARDLREELIDARGNASSGQELRLQDKILGREHVPGSLEDIRARLAEVESDIDTNDERRARAVSDFANELRSDYGIELNDNEAAAVLFGVNGELIVESAVVLNVMVEIEHQLQAKYDSDISQETARNYYGIAAVTRMIHFRMLTRHVEDYESKWFRGLDQINEEATELLLEARRQLDNPELQNSNRLIYENNKRTNERIIDIIEVYRVWLEKWRDRARDDQKLAEESYNAAKHTLFTLGLLNELQGLSFDFYGDFQALDSIDMPELIPLDDKELFEDFLDISRQLAGV